MEWGLRHIGSRELAEWQAFFGLRGPTGDQRADLRAGVVASVVANANRDPKRRRRPFAPRDFMPRFGEDEPEAKAPQAQPWRQQLAMVELLNAALGGADERKRQG